MPPNPSIQSGRPAACLIGEQDWTARGATISKQCEGYFCPIAMRGEIKRPGRGV